MDWSKELIIIVDESRDVAESLRHPLTTAHLLLCLFTLRNRASDFLSDHRITADRLLEQLRQRPTEGPDTWDRVMRRAQDVAAVSNAPMLTSLHVLVALCSFVDSAAYQLMSSLDMDLGTIRNTALSYLTSNAEDEEDVHVTVAPHEQDRDMSAGPLFASAPAQTTTMVHDADPEDDPHTRRARGIREPDDVRRGRRRAPRPKADPNSTDSRSGSRSQGGSAKAGPRGDRGADKATPPAKRKQDRGSASSLAARLYGNRDGQPSRARGADEDSGELRAQRMTTGPLPPTVNRTGNMRSVSAPRRKAPNRLVRKRFELSERDFPLLSKLGRNLSLMAFDGKLDRVIGREDEIDQLIDILNKRRSNNPVLLGDPGVGKTAIVEGLAVRVASEDEDAPPGLEECILVELEASKVVSGTGLRGSFSDRLQKLKAEVAKADGKVVLFLDELHHWVSLGAGGDGSADGAGELKTALARGEFPCIGATTYDEYRKFIEQDPAFARRFQTVRVDEPSPEDAIKILQGVRDEYSAHHGVEFEDAAIEAAVRLTHRYLNERRLPDKAIAALDLAGSRARRIGAASIGRPLIATVVGEVAGISPEKLLMGDAERFLNLEEQLMVRVVGHLNVIERVSHVLRRNYAGFVSGRPIGSFLFLGSTGVGKTELAKALANVLFQDDDAMVRLDMSEYMEAHSVARLIGSPPGYVGHDAGGQLTEAIRRRPYQMVLLDEIEKAHPDVLNVLIQLLDEGRLSDSRGRTVDFSNTVVIMTSNLGAEAALRTNVTRRVGFGASSAPVDEGSDDDSVRLAVTDEARGHFRPEIWNRIDEPLVFLPLQRDQIMRIARIQLTRSSERLFCERQIAFSFAPEVLDLLIERGGFERELGARPMRRTIERLVEAPIADMILRGTVRGPAQLEVVVEDNEIAIVRIDDPGPAE